MKTGSEDNETIHVNLDNSFNPYEDKNLRETQADAPNLDEREPFNDAIKHWDIVSGYRQNRKLSDYPRKIRPIVRIYSIITLLLFFGGLVYSVLRFIYHF